MLFNKTKEKVSTLPEKILEDLLYINSSNNLNRVNRNYIKTVNNINYQPIQGA